MVLLLYAHSYLRYISDKIPFEEIADGSSALGRGLKLYVLNAVASLDSFLVETADVDYSIEAIKRKTHANSGEPSLCVEDPARNLVIGRLSVA